MSSVGRPISGAPASERREARPSVRWRVSGVRRPGPRPRSVASTSVRAKARKEARQRPPWPTKTPPARAASGQNETLGTRLNGGSAQILLKK